MDQCPGAFCLMPTRLFPTDFGDTLDSMGLLHQFLSAGIRPMGAGMGTVEAFKTFGVL